MSSDHYWVKTRSTQKFVPLPIRLGNCPPFPKTYTPFDPSWPFAKAVNGGLLTLLNQK